MNKINFLPTLQDAYEPLMPEQIEILREQVVAEGGDQASVQSRFNYSWGLVKSTVVDDQRLGVKILTDIYKESFQRRRECLYYLTVGCYKLKEYSMAKRYVDILYEGEPQNKQVAALKEMVEEKIQNETLKGIAVITGAVVGVASFAAYYFRSRRR